MINPAHSTLHLIFLVLQVAWAAVENAGYAPRTGTPFGAGVFAASGIDGYLVHHLEGGALKTPLEPALLFLTEVGSEKDYMLATQEMTCRQVGQG